MDFSKYADGTTDCTAFLQQEIDRTTVGGRLVIPSGTYLTGSLFLHSDMTFPEDYKGEIPEYWKVLTRHVPPEVGLPLLRNVTVESVQACADSAHTKKASYEQPVLFYIDTDPVRPVENITFRNVILDGERLGKIRSVKNMRLENVQISVCEETENAAAAED